MLTLRQDFDPCGPTDSDVPQDLNATRMCLAPLHGLCQILTEDVAMGDLTETKMVKL